MADKELSELNPVGPLAGTELLYIVQGGQSYEVTLDQLAAYVQTAQSIVPANLPHRGARVNLTADMTGLSWPMVVGWQAVDFDSDGFWNIGDPTKLVVPAGVTKVRLIAGIRFEALSTAGMLTVSVRKNAVGVDSTGIVPQAANPTRQGTTGFSDNQVGTVTGVIDVVEGDYFDLRLNVSMTNQDQILNDPRTFFEIEVIEYEASTVTA